MAGFPVGERSCVIASTRPSPRRAIETQRGAVAMRRATPNAFGQQGSFDHDFNQNRESRR